MKYVLIRGDKYGHIVYLLVEDTLKAERMNAVDLYSYLERRGYRWNSRQWSKKS